MRRLSRLRHMMPFNKRQHAACRGVRVAPACHAYARASPTRRAFAANSAVPCGVRGTTLRQRAGAAMMFAAMQHVDA